MIRTIAVALIVVALLTACTVERPTRVAAQAALQIQQSTDSLACYDVFELSAQNSAQDSNKFFDVTLDATFTAPDGTSRNIRGFFYGDTTWKVRFRPDVPGQWSYTARMAGVDGLRQQWDGQFTCTPGNAEGPVVRDPNNPFSWMLGNGQLYFPIGLQDCWDPEAKSLFGVIDGEGRGDGSGHKLSVDDYMATYGQAGFNLFRFAQNNCAFPLYGDLDHYSELASQATDQLLASARQHGLRVMFGFFGFDRDPQHQINDVAALNGLDLIAKEKRFIAYSVARWGVYTDFWELLNESQASPAWTTLMSDFVRSIDPDRKPISSSTQPPLPNPVVSDSDFVTPHWYESENELSSDTTTVQHATEWKKAGLPVIVGEQGNTGMNWDPTSAVRMRIRTWTSLFEQIGLVFWNTSWSKAGMNGGVYTPGAASNIYLGPEERGYIANLRPFAQGLDAGVQPAAMSVSNPGEIHVYGLASSSVVAAYLHHFNDHTNSVSGELTLNVPGDPSSSQTLVGSWINPSTGNVLSTVQVAPGQQTIAVPSFTVDVAFIATPSITSSGSPG